jgi:hypothetical protein
MEAICSSETSVSSATIRCRHITFYILHCYRRDSCHVWQYSTQPQTPYTKTALIQVKLRFACRQIQ